MNQCDGCQRGLPISPLGMHRDDSVIFMCTKARYRLELEPVERETFRSVKRERVDVPFFVGGEG